MPGPKCNPGAAKRSLFLAESLPATKTSSGFALHVGLRINLEKGTGRSRLWGGARCSACGQARAGRRDHATMMALSVRLVGILNESHEQARIPVTSTNRFAVLSKKNEALARVFTSCIPMKMWLEIDLSHDGSTIQVSGRGSRDEKPRPHTFGDRRDLPFIQSFASKVERAVRFGRQLEPDVIASAGSLYDDILKGELRDTFTRLTDASKDQGPLLVRIFTHDIALQSIPWEAVCKPGTVEGFWGTDPRLVVARGGYSSEPQNPGTIEGAVRVLVIAPGESASTVSVLRNALDSVIVSGAIEWLEPISGPEIGERILFDRIRKCIHPHIVHFIGHGRIEGGNPMFRLADDGDGNETWISAESFAREIQANFAGDLRLVVLEACEGATPGAFGSAAEAFVAAGTSAVVAHLWPVRATTAQVCSTELYRALTINPGTRGDIGAALTATRRTLLTTSAEAFSPILCLRTTSSVIFKFQGQSDSVVVPDIEPSVEAPESVAPPPFWGREDELARLCTFADDACAGTASVVFVAGERGIGKSALVDAFCRKIKQEKRTTVFVGVQCLPRTGHDDPYWPIFNVLLQLAGAIGNLSLPTDQRALAQMQRTALRALFEVGAELIGPLVPTSALTPRIEALAAHGDAWAQKAATQLLHANEQNRTLSTNRVYWQVAALLEKVTEAQPLVLVFEDLHWVDEASAGLLLHLSARLQRSKLLILGTYRSNMVQDQPNAPHPMTLVLRESIRAHGDVVVNLDQITVEKRKQWSDALLAAESPPVDAKFRNVFFERTAGLPLFALGLLHALHARTKAANEAPALVTEEIDWGKLPTQVEEVIRERLAEMNTSESDMIGLASIEGIEFTVQVLATLRHEDERTLVRTMSQSLEKKYRLVVAAGVQQIGSRRTIRYRFTQGLMQQYVYDNLSDGERLVLHGDVAECLEKLYEGQTETIALVLAHHYMHADAPAKAIEYLIHAGRRANRLSAYREAIGHFEQALNWLERLPPSNDRKRLELSIWMPLCVALMTTDTGVLTKSQTAYERARALCVELGDRVSLTTIVFGLCSVQLLAAEFAAVEKLATECLEMGTSLGSATIQVQAHTSLAVVAFWCTGFPQTRAHMAEVARLYEPGQRAQYESTLGHDPLVVVQGYSIWMRALQGDVDGALEDARRVVKAAEQENNPFSLAFALQALVGIAVILEQAELCQKTAERLVEIGTKYEFPIYIGLGLLLREYRTFEVALVADFVAGLEAIYRKYLESGTDKMMYVWYCMLRRDAYHRAGDDAHALATAEELLSFVQQYGVRTLAPECLRYKGETLMRLGRRQEAEQTLREGLTIAQQQDVQFSAQRIAHLLSSMEVAAS